MGKVLRSRVFRAAFIAFMVIGTVIAIIGSYWIHDNWLAPETSQPATVSVTAATLPANSVNAGENVIFAFVVESTMDTTIDTLTLALNTEKVVMGDNFYWYDQNGDYVAQGAIRAGKVIFRPDPLRLPGGTSHTFSIRGDTWQEGFLFARIEQMEAKGVIEGVPSVWTTLEIR